MSVFICNLGWVWSSKCDSVVRYRIVDIEIMATILNTNIHDRSHIHDSSCMQLLSIVIYRYLMLYKTIEGLDD